MRFCHSFRSGIPLFRAGHQRVTHPFATSVLLHPFDLHVLGTPPAFILSQDQTLRRIFSIFRSFLFASIRRNCLVCFYFCCFSIVKVLLRRFLYSQRQGFIICFSPFLSRPFLFFMLFFFSPWIVRLLRDKSYTCCSEYLVQNKSETKKQRKSVTGRGWKIYCNTR